MLGKMERKILAVLLAAAISIPTMISWDVKVLAAEAEGDIAGSVETDTTGYGEIAEGMQEEEQESISVQESEEDFIPLETIVAGQKSEELQEETYDSASGESMSDTQGAQAGTVQSDTGNQNQNVQSEQSGTGAQNQNVQSEQEDTVVQKNQSYSQPEGELIRFLYHADQNEDLTIIAQDFRIVKVYETVLPGEGEEPQEEMIQQFIYGEEKRGYGTFSAKSGTDYVITVKPLAGQTATWKLEESQREGDYVYTVLDDGTVELVKYAGTDKNAVLPSSIKGKKVTQFSPYTFLENDTIESVVIPNTVTSFQYEPFKGCSALKSITVNEGSPIKELPSGVFRKLDALEAVTVHADIEMIGDKAFSTCETLCSVQIDGKIKEIGEQAFYSCSSLEEVEMDLSELECIGEKAFRLTTSLKEMDLSVTKLKKIETKVFSNSGVEKVLLPAGLIEIASSAFEESKLKSIQLPESLTYIGFDSFRLTPLESLQIPDKVTFIGSKAFQSTNITSVKIPDSVTTMEKGAFSNCRYLKDIEIGNGLEEIVCSAFEGCPAETIRIGSKVKCLGGGAFSDNKQITSITVPVNVTRIEYHAFKGCTNLAEINLPDTLEYIGNRAFDETKWLDNQEDGYIYVKDHLYQYKGEMTDKKTEIKAGTKGIVGEAFQHQKSIEESEIPAGVRYIGEGAYYNCVNMKSITIPMTVTEIGYRAVGWKEKELEGWSNYSYYASSLAEKIEGFVIYGVAGTAAEAYAKENEIKFVPIEPQYIRGDLDRDGDVNISDLRYLLRSVCGKIKLDELQILAGDIAGSGTDSVGDGKVDIADLRKLLRFICGKIENI